MAWKVRSVALALAVCGTAACGDDDDTPDTSCDAATCRADAGDDEDTADANGADSDADLDGGTSEAAVDDGGTMRNVTIRFKGKVGSADLTCGKHYADQGATRLTATPQDFRFFVQEVRLVRKGTQQEERVQFDVAPPFQRAEVALIDFTNGDGSCGNGGNVIHTTITGKVPEGEYDGIVFVNGVPEELNHAGPAETAGPPLDDVTLFWNWLGGYRFIVAELLPVSSHGDAGAPEAGVGDAGHASDAGADGGTDAGHASTGPQAAFLHVGSTGCSGTPATGFSCMRQARNEVRLSGFDPERNVIAADLGAVFRASDLNMPPQCHGIAPVCADGYAAFGLDMNSGQPAAVQSVFHVE